MRTRTYISILTFVCVVLSGIFIRAESVTLTSSQVAPSLMKRVIKKFDFNERPLGNLEDTPMYWTKVRAYGFPHFVNGKFDEHIGTPPPSFKLQLNGGNLGYLFLARKISAFPGSDHKIIAKVKTANMKYARGYIEAFYLDRFGNPLKDTIRYSKLIAPVKGKTWQTITVNLPFSNPKGRFIGLGVFLVQPDHFPKIYESQIVSYKKDIFATMWVDDITIIRLPQVRIKMANNQLIYKTNEDVNVLALVADPCAKDIHARMLLIDRTNGNSVKWNIPIENLPPIDAILQGQAHLPEFSEFSLGKLASGDYTIRLEVLSGNTIIISKAIEFVIINYNRPNFPKNEMGIDLSENKLYHPHIIGKFIAELNAGWVLIPFWRNDIKCVSTHLSDSQPDIIISSLKRDETRFLGGFVSIPKDISLNEKLISPTIWDLFASDEKVWKIPLSMLLTRHADKIENWVFGNVHHYWQEPDERIPNLLAKIKGYFAQFQGNAKFIVDWPAMRAPASKALSADNYHIKLPVELVPASFENYFIQWKRLNYNPIVTLQTQNLKLYELRPAALDFVKRIIETKKAGIRTLAVSGLWKEDVNSISGKIIPSAYYPVYANAIDRLGNSRYMGQIKISPSDKGILFGNSQHAVLVICEKGVKTDNKDNKFIKGTISLGRDLKAYDMWGRAMPIIYEQEGWLVPYKPIIFIDGIAPDLAYFISTIQFAQPNLASKFGIHRVKLIFRNTFGQTIIGTVHVRASRFWHFDPSGARFTLIPGGKFILPMKLRFPSNEPIGQKVITVTLDFEAQRAIHLKLLVPLGVSPSDLKMRVLWFMRNDKLVVLQEIRNYGKTSANLKAFLIAPNRPRMERQIRKLMPGQFAVKEYVVGNWKQMFGKKIRVGFREIRGMRMVNEIITIE